MKKEWHSQIAPSENWEFCPYTYFKFRYDPNWLVTKNKLDSTEEAKSIHDFFKSIMIAMTSDAISLLDVPALLGLSQPFISPVDVRFKYSEKAKLFLKNHPHF